MSSFEETIATFIPTAFEYDSIYVSIGGKINEHKVRFNKPALLVDYEFPTNAQYQMVPAFIRYPRYRSSTLVVVIDDFSNPDLYQINQIVIDNIQQKHPHIRVILYDTKLTNETLDEFAKSLVRWIVSSKIAPEKCMIANYLRFRTTLSVIDSQLEFNIPKLVQNALNSYKIEKKHPHNHKTTYTTPYSDILYQWFGYQYYTYNLVFSYKEYNTYMLRHLSILNLLHECCDMTSLVSGNVSNMFMFEKTKDPKTTELLITFLKHSVDITSYSKRSTSICSRLLDFVPNYAISVISTRVC